MQNEIIFNFFFEKSLSFYLSFIRLPTRQRVHQFHLPFALAEENASGSFIAYNDQTDGRNEVEWVMMGWW